MARRRTISPNNHEMGIRLRALRREKGLTLKELSSHSGISVGLLSEIERGQGNPCVATISTLADALAVNVGGFFPVQGTRRRVVKRKERKGLKFPYPGPHYELLTPDLAGRIELLWIEMPPLCSTQSHPFIHSGDEAGVVVEGQVEIHVGEEVYTLTEGDSISFPSSIPHWSRNPRRKRAILIWAITPPSF